MRPSATPPERARLEPLEPIGSQRLGLTSDEQLELALAALAKGHTVELRVSGTCMRPWIFGGDRVRVAPLRRPPRRGQIVVVQSPKGLLAHRVVETRGGRVVTRGDLSDEADPSLALDRVLGVARSTRGRLGFTVILEGRWRERAGLLGAPVLRTAVRAAARLGLISRPG